MLNKSNFLVPSPFDSKHYGMKVAKISIQAASSDLHRTIKNAKRQGYKLIFIHSIYKRKNKQLTKTLTRQIESMGGNYINSLISLKRIFRTGLRTKKTKSIAIIDSLQKINSPKEVNALSRICGEAIYQSHLIRDTRLPLNKTRRLHYQWAKNDLTGRAQWNFLARVEGQPVGFVSILVTKNDPNFKNKTSGFIDMVVVDKKFQGRGIGSDLMIKALEWLSKNTDLATLGTQADNPAFRLYTKMGFIPYIWQDIYHLWTDSLKL